MKSRKKRNQTMTVPQQAQEVNIKGRDDSAGIREARFAFPHYCHASNYASSKATVRRLEMGRRVGGGGYKGRCGAGGVAEGVRRVAVAALLARRLSRVARFAANGRNQS